MKMRLIKIIFLFALILFLISFATAVCEDSKRIMKLYQATNSHGALWNDLFYPEDVCTDTAGSNSHDCKADNSNLVIRLSGATNAHAEIPTNTNYNTLVCYGELTCVSRQNSCNSGEAVILSLSSETNAHIALGDYADYPIKICCKGGEVITPVVCNNNGTCDAGETNAKCPGDCKDVIPEVTGDSYWTNMNDIQINNADTGDSVKLVLNVGGIKGKSIKYVIYKQEDLGINWLDWFVRDSVIAEFDNKGVAVWEAGKKQEDGSFSEGKYYFSAEIIDSGRKFDSKDTETYGILEVAKKNTPLNSLPLIEIVKPVDNSHFIINSITGLTEDISFEQKSSDQDDDLKISWDFGDGNSEEFENSLTTGKGNTTYKYSSPGTKLITLTASEMKRTQKAEDKHIIYIHKIGYNIFSIIDIPNEPVDAGIVTISGLNSYAEKCFESQDACNVDIEIPSSCYQPDNSNPVFCKKLDINLLNFRWRIDNTEQTETTLSFDRLFAGPEDYFIELNVSFTTPSAELISDKSLKLLVVKGGIECSSDGKFWKDFGFSPPQEFSTNDNCLNDNSVNSKKCCPAPLECIDTGKTGIFGDIWDCKPKGVYFCSDYKTENECNGFTQWVADNTIELQKNNKNYCGNKTSFERDGKLCSSKTGCKCRWDNINKNCTAIDTKETVCKDPGTGDEEKEEGSCSYALKKWEDKCESEGIVEAFWEAKRTGDYPEEECRDAKKTIQCEEVTKLGFFGIFNFVITGLIITLIYYFYFKLNCIKYNRSN